MAPHNSSSTVSSSSTTTTSNNNKMSDFQSEASDLLPSIPDVVVVDEQSLTVKQPPKRKKMRNRISLDSLSLAYL